jgi:BNR/Asp-box repeat
LKQLTMIFFRLLPAAARPNTQLITITLFALVAQPVIAQSVNRQKVQIVAGSTVQVSKAFANLPHYENLAAGDPKHLGRLITCSMTYPRELGKLNYHQCYVSFDGGKTWDPTLKVSEGYVNSDPAVIYGYGDDVYEVALVVSTVSDESGEPNAPTDDSKTVVFKSSDGGRTWSETARFKLIDREYIGMDLTKGKYDGRIYVVGQGYFPNIDGRLDVFDGASLQLFRSVDGGKNFLGPVCAKYPHGATIGNVGPGVVLSDGTFVVMFEVANAEHRNELHIISSKDGGETFARSVRVADPDLFVDPGRSKAEMLGQLAIDPGSKPFKDRLYIAFPSIVDKRIQIELSYSTDKGETWSKPTVVNDDRSPEDGSNGPDHMLPSVAVNRDGVVLVTWYDRREATDNLGWRLRAAASLDGGETFSASVPVTDGRQVFTPKTTWDLRGQSVESASLLSLWVSPLEFMIGGGHTSGLAVDADGTFVPTWIDNRTGVAQLWSAPIRVSGAVIKHGTTDLAELEDITKSIIVRYSKPDFDRETGRLTMTVQLRNSSKDTLERPMKMRVVNIESEIGVPEIGNADNTQNGTGAVWDFSSQLPEGGLAPMKLSAPKTLTFRIGDLRPLRQGKDFKFGFLSLDTSVFGKVRKESSSKRISH